MSGALYQKPNKAIAPAAEARPPSLSLRLEPPVAAALAPVTAEEMRRVQGREGFEAVGVHRRLPGPVSTLSAEGGANRTSVAGAWDRTSAGPIWRLHLISRDAFAMRLHFHDFQVGAGRVWIHTSEGQVAGPYTGAGLFDNGAFWSDLIFGQSMTVEYQPAPGDPAGLAVPFELREISHIWRDPRALSRGGSPAPPWPASQALPAADSGAKALQPRSIGAGPEPVEQEAACHVDVTCSPEWAETARGVGMILFEQGDGTGVCSGSLLNTRAGTFEPYFLTAAHCLKTESVARTVLSFWRFQSDTCNGPPPQLRDVSRTTAGARLLSTLGDFGDPKGDMTFLQILGDLPNGVFFQGWDPAQPSFGTRVTGIHHPRGTFKRISSGRIAPDTIFDTDPEVYSLVAETNGRTENGSSGSAMFSQPGVVIGALSFGLKTDDVCGINPSPAGYTNFSVIYPEIRGFLETGQAPPPPPADPPTVLLSGQPERFEVGPVAEPTLFSGANSFLLEIPEQASRVTLTLTSDDPAVDVDLFARFDQDTDLASGGVLADFESVGLDGNEQIVIDAATNPPLRAGSLFVSLVLFTTNAVSSGTLTATVEIAPPPPPPSGETLISGQSTSFDLPPVDGPTLFGGASSYRIDVPEGATQLDVRIATQNAGVDVDLHLRRDTPPAVENGNIVSDFESVSLTGDELVTVTPESGLAPGVYFAALAIYTENARAQGQIRADISLGGSDPSGALLLSSGEQGRFDLPAVESPTFFTDVLYAVDVPAGANRLVLDLVAETPDVDVDLFVRLGQPPVLQDGRILANFRAQGLTGTEQIVIDSGSEPPLQPGRYFVGLAVFTAGRVSSGRVVATVEAGPPEVQLSAVTHAASFEQGVVAPGQIVSLFGSRMGPAQGVQPGLDPSGRVPTFVEGTIVLFGGVPAPLFFVRADQINAQVPYSVAGRGVIDVVGITNGVATNVTQVQVRDAAPGFFTYSTEPSRVIAFNSDGKFNSPENPARRGDFVVLYITGAGLTDGPNEEGLPAPSNPLALTRLPARVRFGGVEQTPFFTGLAPGFAGLTQVNVFIPENGPSGPAVPLSIVIGGLEGSVQPTISIQ